MKLHMKARAGLTCLFLSQLLFSHAPGLMSCLSMYPYCGVCVSSCFALSEHQWLVTCGRATVSRLADSVGLSIAEACYTADAGTSLGMEQRRSRMLEMLTHIAFPIALPSPDRFFSGQALRILQASLCPDQISHAPGKTCFSGVLP